MNLTSLKEGLFGDLIIRRIPVLYGKISRKFKQLENADACARTAFTEEKCKDILKHASRTKFYKDYKDWGALPLLTRNPLQEDSAKFLVSTLLPTSKASTSGTTGQPLKLQRSGKAIVVEQVAIDSFVAKAGVKLKNSKVAILRGDDVKDPTDFTPPFWKYKLGKRHLTFSANHLCKKTIAAYIEALEEFNPDILWVYPTVLRSICNLSADLDIKLPNLKLILSSSDILQNDLRLQAGNKFDVPIYDYYGQAERVTLATSTQPQEYYFNAAYAKTELIYDHEDDNFSYYYIIGTNFWNAAYPLLRYNTEDLAILPKGLSKEDVREIELGIKPFLGIFGRSKNYLISPDGVLLTGLGHVAQNVNNVTQMQLIQKKIDEIDILVVPAKHYSKKTEEEIMQLARTKIPDSIKLNIKVVEEVRLTNTSEFRLIMTDI